MSNAGSAAPRQAGALPLLSVSALLLVLAAIAPVFFSLGNHSLAAFVLREFFSRLCHQDPARSFYWWGAPLAVCVRCLGIYLGAAAGFCIRINRRLALQAVMVAATLNVADVLAESAGLHGNLPGLRFVFGVLLGTAVAAMLGGHLARIPHEV